MKTNWKEELQTLLNCDLKELYPLARSLNRKLYFYVGPTNSGKTYEAMNELKKADCGIYLAPLRLLALEGYETLRKDDIPASLVTGEEQIFDEDASHVCSTIEMIDFDMDTDVSVIDEIQMLGDVDRGWAWVNAIIGVPSKKVIMTGSVNALDAVKKIASYLGEELEVVKFKRKNELKVLQKATTLKEIENGTALIAFSRNDVLKYKQKLQKFHKVSVIYGNLSPEVRRDEARRFREGESQILVATDAIAMGLNLPIKTILFTTDTKFDGVSKRLITVNEITQIAGRAGRHVNNGNFGITGQCENLTSEEIELIENHKYTLSATTEDLLSGLYDIANDSQKILIEDWLTKVIEYDLAIDKAFVSKLPDGRYEVTLDVRAIRLSTDNEGQISEIGIDESINFGLYSSHPESNKTVEITIESQSITQKKSTITLIASEKPQYAMIDPSYTRLDKNLSDNITKIGEK